MFKTNNNTWACASCNFIFSFIAIIDEILHLDIQCVTLCGGKLYKNAYNFTISCFLKCPNMAMVQTLKTMSTQKIEIHFHLLL